MKKIVGFIVLVLFVVMASASQSSSDKTSDKNENQEISVPTNDVSSYETDAEKKLQETFSPENNSNDDPQNDNADNVDPSNEQE